MVTGGLIQPNGTDIYLDSTEMLVLEDTEWRTLPTARLPSPRWHFVAATLDNKVFIFGKNILIIRLTHLTILMSTGGSDSSGALSTIHTLNMGRNTWELAGQMTSPRYGHAIQVIEDVAQQCP